MLRDDGVIGREARRDPLPAALKLRTSSAAPIEQHHRERELGDHEHASHALAAALTGCGARRRRAARARSGARRLQRWQQAEQQRGDEW